MKVRVCLFARAKDLAGTESIEFELPTGATTGELRRRLAADFPELAGLLERSAMAVDDEFASDDWPVRDGSKVALLPPVSGG